jgi:hypothetical protein
MNWGKSIVIVYVIFVLGMGYLVYRSTQETFEVVDLDYYQREKEFTTQLEAENNANAHGMIPKIEHSKVFHGIVIPVKRNQPFSGGIFAYCPTAKKLDTKIAIKSIESVKDSIIKVDLSVLNPAVYILKVSWMINQDKYYSEVAYKHVIR